MAALSKPVDAAPGRFHVLCTRLRGGGCGPSMPAPVMPALDEVSPVAKRPSNARYTEPAIVFELASTGDVRLLSFNWLAERAKSGLPLPHRQELPEAAFADMAALRETHAALPPHVAKAVVPVVSISYCWLSAAEPDATGEQLRHIVDVLQEHAKAPPWDEPGDVATRPPEQAEHLTALETLEKRPASQAWHSRPSPRRYSPGTHGTCVGAAVGGRVGMELVVGCDVGGEVVGSDVGEGLVGSEVGRFVGMGVGHALCRSGRGCFR